MIFRSTKYSAEQKHLHKLHICEKWKLMLSNDRPKLTDFVCNKADIYKFKFVFNEYKLIIDCDILISL